MRLVALVLALVAAGPAAAAEGVTAARYADPTTRYPHGILGDEIEYGALVLDTDAGRSVRIVLPESRVFEDLEPRVVDLDGDGAAEVIAVETDIDRGARLSIYGPDGLIAANDFIGRSNRWLAPVGAADLDGDGLVEIAYVDRPHLAKILRIYRYENRALTPVASLDQVTNHRIGEDFISGGIRECGKGPEMVLATADWSRLVAVRLRSERLEQRDLGPFAGPGSFARALACQG